MTLARDFNLPGVWGNDANTTIPSEPSPGTAYRRTTLDEAGIEAGWAYATPPDSADFNQAQYLLGRFIEQLEEQGILSWNTNTSYTANAFVIASDGALYKAVRDNTGQDPTTDTGDDWEEFGGGDFLPLTGGTLTGPLSISGNIADDAHLFINGRLGMSARATTAFFAQNAFYDTVSLTYKYKDTTSDLGARGFNFNRSLGVQFFDTGSIATTAGQEFTPTFIDIGGSLADEYVSSEQTITSGGTLTLSHGLGDTPKLVTVELVCKTAEYGYSVGDVVEVLGQIDPEVNCGVSVVKDSTNISVRYGSRATAFSVVDKSNGDARAATNANWRAVFRAYA